MKKLDALSTMQEIALYSGMALGTVTKHAQRDRPEVLEALDTLHSALHLLIDKHEKQQAVIEMYARSVHALENHE